jgi:hypothetical protein
VALCIQAFAIRVRIILAVCPHGKGAIAANLMSGHGEYRRFNLLCFAGTAHGFCNIAHHRARCPDVIAVSANQQQFGLGIFNGNASGQGRVCIKPARPFLAICIVTVPIIGIRKERNERQGFAIQHPG